MNVARSEKCRTGTGLNVEKADIIYNEPNGKPGIFKPIAQRDITPVTVTQIALVVYS